MSVSIGTQWTEVQIALSGKRGKGKYTLVDDEDFEYLNNFRWYYSTNGYAVRGMRKTDDKKGMWFLHWDVMGKQPKGLVVDHINHNPLDNRKENLRVCTHAQNMMNRKIQIGGSSKYKGVYWDKSKNRWRARVRKNQKYIHLGYFKDQTDAANAYNKKAIAVYGEFSLLNNV